MGRGRKYIKVKVKTKNEKKARRERRRRSELEDTLSALTRGHVIPRGVARTSWRRVEKTLNDAAQSVAVCMEQTEAHASRSIVRGRYLAKKKRNTDTRYGQG